MIAGCNNCVAIAEFGRCKQRFFASFLPLEHGIPSHDTFNDVLNRLNPNEFSKAFTQWVCRLGELKDDIVALDGKVMRRTWDKSNGIGAIHLVSAWSTQNNMCFAQVKVADKSNEVTAIPKLLELLDIKGATITTDAMGCQTQIAEQIIQRDAEFIFALKGNQGRLHKDIKVYFAKSINNNLEGVTAGLDHFTEIDQSHGRAVFRKVWVTSDMATLHQAHPKWTSVNTIIAVDCGRLHEGKLSYERRFYISSHENKSAEYFAQAIRSHWHVENKLHWHLDVSFDEDQNRHRSGYAAENISLINKTALNLLKNETTVKAGIKTKRLKAGWDDDYMLKVLMVGFTTD